MNIISLVSGVVFTYRPYEKDIYNTFQCTKLIENVSRSKEEEKRKNIYIYISHVISIIKNKYKKCIRHWIHYFTQKIINKKNVDNNRNLNL